MSHVGRGPRFLALSVLLTYCLAGAGCYLSLNYGVQDKPPETTDEGSRQEAARQEAARIEAARQQTLHPGGDITQMGFQQGTKPADLPGDSGDKSRERSGNPPQGGTVKPADPVLTPGLPHGPNTGEIPPLPTELQKVTFPPYIIEPPDVLLLDAVRLIPRPPYRIEALDVLTLQVTETFPSQPIVGLYPVQPDGTILLGFTYGMVRVAGMTLEQAQQAVRDYLGNRLKNPQVALGLATFRGLQQVRGQHLVRPDGTISLGTYGCVYVAGLTLSQARQVVEGYLSQFLLDPEVAVDVLAYNSKYYYVIADGAGYGQQVFKFPSTGNETVLDAIQLIGGIPAVGSKRRIWVARPAPANHACLQILPVDWLAISQGGATRTNYQLFPGDRVFIRADPLILLDNMLAKVFNPVQRVLGTVLLGTSVFQSFRNNGNGVGNNGAFFVTGVR